MDSKTGLRILCTLALAFLLPFYSIACRCVPVSLESSYAASSHVALVQVLKVEFDSKDVSKLLLTVRVINQLKGTKVTKYKTDATYFKEPTKDGVTGRYGCSLGIHVGTTWLLFASSNEKVPFFHYCSKSTDDNKLITERLTSIRTGFK